MRARRLWVAIPAAMMAFSAAVAPAAAQPSPVKACTSLAEDGQRLRAAGKLIDARDKLMACSASECPQVVRADCAQWASEILAATPTIVIDAKDSSGNDVADAKVFVDGKQAADRIDGRPIPLDPGSRSIRIERSDGTSGSRSIVAKENAKAREVRIVLSGSPSADVGTPPPEPSRSGWGWQRFAGVGLVVVGTIGLTYSMVKYLSYTSDESSLRDKFEAAESAAAGCASNSPPESTCGKNIATREELRAAYNANEDQVKSDKPLLFTGAVGGVLFIAGGIMLFVLAPSTKSSTSKPSVQGAPVITPQFAGMTLGGSF